MRTVLSTVLLICLMVTLLPAQNQSSVIVHFDYALRTKGEPVLPSKLGVGVGLTARIATTIPVVMLTAGGRYLYFPESNKPGNAGNVTLKAYDLVTPFLGLQLGKSHGPYLLAVETGDFTDSKTRFGLDAGVGYRIPNDQGKPEVDFSLKYCLANLMGKDEGESIRSYLLFEMGFAF